MSDTPDEVATTHSRAGPLTMALAGCMALAIFVAPTVGALGPFLVPEFGLSRSQLGTLTTSIFVVAAGFSVLAGRMVDAVGGRLALVAMLVTAALSLVLVSRASAYTWLLLCVAASGLCQALANPATNKVISTSIAGPRQGVTTGIKQAGVPVGGALVGLLLPPMATVLGWRSALLLAATLPLVAIGFVLWLVPTGRSSRYGPPIRGTGGAAGDGDTQLPSFLPGLTAYSLFLGGSIGTVSTYLPLYAHQALGFPEITAGRVFAVFGLAGVLGRLAWTYVVSRHGGALTVLTLLAVAAAGFGALFSVASHSPEALVWVAAAGMGATATAANAVSMLLVVTRSATGLAGRASGRVVGGFFAGFVVFPPLFGALVDAFDGSYRAGWLLVAGELVAAALVALALLRAPNARPSGL